MMDIEQQKIEEEGYTQHSKRRVQRRAVSNSTRRRSTLLYLEKYGLDQPNWHTTSSSPKTTEEPESYVDAFAPNTQTIIDMPVKPPVSIRNSVQSSSSLLQKRPARFIKPEKSSLSTVNVHVSVPTEFKKVHQILDKYASKLYMEGYLYKRHHLNSDGSTSESHKTWKLYYIELSGPVLTLWDTEKEGDMIIPRYINITDATVHVKDTLENIFSLNSAGANRFLFRAHNPHNLKEWILAIHLSCFECARIQEIYTFKFITRPQFKEQKKKNIISKSGILQVRFPRSTSWKQYWVVVTNHKVEKRLFNKKSVLTEGKIMFYESKKSKYPIMTFDQVVQAYTVYPESPKLISLATLFKIEGCCLYHGEKVNASSSALIMAPNTNDMVLWLTSIFDAFQLYGRPDELKNDPTHPQALNYGDLPHLLQCPSLMLDMQDVVQHVDIGHDSNLATSKKQFAAIFHETVFQQAQQANKGSSLSSSSSTTLHEMQSQNKAEENKRNSFMMTNSKQPTQLRSMTLASSNDSEATSTADSDDDESLYQFGSKPEPNHNRATVASSAMSLKSAPNTPEPFLPPVISHRNDQFSASVMSEVKQRQLQRRWDDTVSVDARMVTTPTGSVAAVDDDEEDIAANYVLQQSILLNQDRAKKLEYHARATGQPYVQLSMKKKKAANPQTGLVGSIEDNKRNRTRGMSVDEQMARYMMEQQQVFMHQQQLIQQSMMPMIDPRMMPVMSTQPIMMYDPRMSIPMMQSHYPCFPSTMSSPNLSHRVMRQQQQQFVQNNHRRSAFRKSAMMPSSSSSSSSVYSVSSAKHNNNNSRK